ncbi:hypothetical protein D3C81_1430850 [compost metagenome]
MPGTACLRPGQQLQLRPATFYLQAPYATLRAPVVQLLTRHHQQAKVAGLTGQAGAGHLVRRLQQAVFEQQRPLLTLEPGWGRHVEDATGLGRQNKGNPGLQVCRGLTLPLALHDAALRQRPVPDNTRA